MLDRKQGCVMGNEKKISFVRNGSEWEVDGKKAKDHKTRFERNEKDCVVVFQIGTPNGRYIFTRDPIWIKLGVDACPSTFGCGDVFEIEKVEPTRLKMKNKNEVEAEYRYQLNVYDKIEDKYVPIDPILSNGGHD
jgi:hypothetical protein